MNEKVYNANLPAFLHRTDEQLAEERERQERMRRDLRLKGARQTPAEIAYARAFELEPVIRGNLEQIDKNLHPGAYNETLLQLAEVRAGQGDFTEASNLAAEAENPEMATEYASLHLAVALDDDVTCNCPAETVRVRTPQGQASADIPPTFVATEVYSQKHGRAMPLVRCANCGFQNVQESPTPPDLSAIERDRMQLPEGK